MAFSAAHMQQLGTGLCKHSSRSRASLSVHARFGGRDSGLILGPGGNNYGDQNQKAKEARLILPGQQRQTPSRGPQRLIQPEQQRPGGRPGGENFLPDDSTLGLVGETQNLVGGPPTLNKYRPPAGFMNDTLPEDSTANMEPQDMLNRLRSRAGHWHELAKLFPALNSKGFDSATIDEMTGITPAEQNKWMVAATVYESVQASAAVPRETLARFNGEGYDLLYPFRFLSAERRAIAAQYIVEQGLDAPMCEILARSMKEYERRPTERTGFTEHPADCLAFKYLRDALECRRREEAVQKIEQGLQVALSDGARLRLLELLEEEEAPAPASSGVSASLVTLRLSPDELGTRPVCVVGELGAVQPEQLEAAPRTSQSGAFGIFTLEAPSASSPAAARAPASWAWVALPAWRALAMARHPVALTIRDCATVPAVVTGSKAKTDDDKRRLQGVGILVCDKAPELLQPDQLQPDAWYLAVPEGPGAARGGVAMVDGTRAAQVAARGSLLAQVLFLARPPQKDVPDQGHNLLQL